MQKRRFNRFMVSCQELLLASPQHYFISAKSETEKPREQIRLNPLSMPASPCTATLELDGNEAEEGYASKEAGGNIRDQRLRYTEVGHREEPPRCASCQGGSVCKITSKTCCGSCGQGRVLQHTSEPLCRPRLVHIHPPDWSPQVLECGPALHSSCSPCCQ